MSKKHMTEKDFMAVGFLPEVNRLFLHPHGLALSVVVEGDVVRLGEIWDCRDDPEGIVFVNGLIDLRKIEAVKAERLSHELARQQLLGSSIQGALSLCRRKRGG